MIIACGVDQLSIALIIFSLAGFNWQVTMTSIEGQDVVMQWLHTLQILDGHSRARMAYRCPGCTGYKIPVK